MNGIENLENRSLFSAAAIPAPEAADEVPPVFTVSPSSGSAGSIMTVTISGVDTNFVDEFEISFDFGECVNVDVIWSPAIEYQAIEVFNLAHIVDATTIRVEFGISRDAVLGPRTVQIRNGDETFELVDGFTVVEYEKIGEQESNNGFDTAQYVDYFYNWASYSSSYYMLPPELNPIVTGTVGGTDDSVDGFSFEMEEPSFGSIRLTNMTGDADLLVFDSSHRLIASSSQAGTIDEFLEGEIPAGRYYLAVAAASGETSYDLEFEMSPDPGEIPISIPLLDHPDIETSVREYVGRFDQVDNYLVYAPDSVWTRLLVSDLEASVTVRIYDEALHQIGQLDQNGASDQSWEGLIPEGIYYLTVSSEGELTPYTLSFDRFHPFQADEDENGTGATAIDLGSFSSTQTVVSEGTLNNSDSLDAFKFTATVSGQGSLVLRNLNLNAALRVYDSLGNLLAEAQDVQDSELTLAGLIPAGTYYITVHGREAGEISYELEFEFVTNDGGPSVIG